jgi:peptidylprolyl isomerase
VFVVRRSPLARPVLARTASALVAAVLVTGALAGCSVLSLGAGCDIAPGDASTTITATGDLGSTPAVEFPTPLLVDSPEASVLSGSDGAAIEPGSMVFGNAVYFDAQSGASIGDTPQFFAASDAGLAIGQALACATTEARIAVVGPAGELSANADLIQAIGADTVIVAVIDVQQVFLGKANGVNQLPQDGMPTVVTAVDGTPGISSTYVPAAEEARTAVVKAGGGATVAEGDTVVFHARSWNWTAGSTTTVTLGQIDTWSAGSPVALIPTVDALIGEQALVDALVGSKVGSQMLIVIPVADDPTAATVYVFDILGILSQD